MPNSSASNTPLACSLIGATAAAAAVATLLAAPLAQLNNEVIRSFTLSFVLATGTDTGVADAAEEAAAAAVLPLLLLLLDAIVEYES
jgi:hypothetical protein